MNLSTNQQTANPKLRNAIFKAGLTQKQVAELSTVSEWYISMHIRGRYILSEEQRQKIVGALNRPVWELF